jgi:NAD(P)H-dependent flavin oxidoreductase YrpB (nitropropane dioxygenase family)
MPAAAACNEFPLVDPAGENHYYVSVVPRSGYSIGGASFTDGEAATVYVNQHNIPTAQISILIFEDNFPINNAPDLPGEDPANPDATDMSGFQIVVEDAGGRYGASAGVQSQDAFGNPLGTTYNAAGDPMGWGDKIKGAGFKWLHIVPSVKGAIRCQKAGVDLVVASGHEGGFHTSWEPVHSMVLLPAVVEALAGSGIPVVGAGGFCDGKTLAAALTLGAAGAQMGTRFLATKESDFAQLWKEGIVKAQDRGTLVARGFVGPARWIKTPVPLKHLEATLEKAPGVFLGKPDDGVSKESQELIASEVAGINATYEGDEERAMMAGGECAQRVADLPPVQELVDRIVAEAVGIIEDLPKRYLA